MRGGYQILDLSSLTVGTEGVVKNSFNTISNHNDKVVMVKTPDGNDVFAEFSKSGDDYIGAYMGSDGKCYSVVINSDNECTITDEGETGADDYTELSHKPQINSVELTGNKSLGDLGITDAISTAITTALTTEVITSGHPNVSILKSGKVVSVIVSGVSMNISSGGFALLQAPEGGTYYLPASVRPKIGSHGVATNLTTRSMGCMIVASDLNGAINFTASEGATFTDGSVTYLID